MMTIRTFTLGAAIAAALCMTLVSLADQAPAPRPADRTGDRQLLGDKEDKKLEKLKEDAAHALERAEKEIENIENYYDSSVGYVIFPKVTRGGLVVGGAHGNGVVYERTESAEEDTIIGTAEVTQGSIGFQIGGQTFSELIFFEDEQVFEKFKEGTVEFSGRASGVAGGEGANAEAEYDNGIAVFVFGQKGLMGEASIGGQGFSYKPLEE